MSHKEQPQIALEMDTEQADYNMRNPQIKTKSKAYAIAAAITGIGAILILSLTLGLYFGLRSEYSTSSASTQPTLLKLSMVQFASVVKSPKTR